MQPKLSVHQEDQFQEVEDHYQELELLFDQQINSSENNNKTIVSSN